MASPRPTPTITVVGKTYTKQNRKNSQRLQIQGKAKGLCTHLRYHILLSGLEDYEGKDLAVEEMSGRSEWSASTAQAGTK